MSPSVVCKFCGSKTRITNRYTISPEYAKLYCRCLNEACNHGFSMLLTFDCTQTPPLSALNSAMIEAAFNAIAQLPKEQQQIFIDRLRP